MSFTVRPVMEADLERIMNWRMDPEITKYMNTNPKLTLEGQRQWFARIRENKDVRYWIIEVDGQPAGVINLTGLSREDGVLGWAYYVGEKKLRSMKLALSLEMSLYDYIFDVLGKKALVGDIFTLNKGVIKLHLLCGSYIVEEKNNHVCKEDIWYDVTFMEMSQERWDEVRASKKYEKISFDNTGINTLVIREIRELARKYNVDKVLLFGSRARGDHKPKSDIDLAFSGGDGVRFTLAVDEETSTLLKFDVVNLDGSVQPQLLESIRKEGRILYEKV